MNRIKCVDYRLGTVILALLSLCAGAEEPWVRVGAVLKGNVRLEMEGSHSQDQDPGAAYLYKRLPGSVGSLRDYADRRYTNGFVFRDVGTGSPNSMDPNTTWFWSYADAGQADGGFLYFVQPGGREVTRTVESSGAERAVNHIGMGGVEVAAGMPLMTVEKGPVVEVAGGLRLFAAPGRLVAGQPVLESFQRRDFSVRDGYDIASIQVPAAPYAGTYLGPFDNPPVIPSPLLSNIPEQRREVNSRMAERWQGDARAKAEVDTTQFELRAGPRLLWERPGGMELYVQPALTLSYILLDVTRTETYGLTREGREREVVARWRDSAEDEGWRWGAGIQLGMQLPLREAWHLEINAGADWTESMTAQVGPASVRADLSGYSVGIAFVRRLGGKAPANP